MKKGLIMVVAVALLVGGGLYGVKSLMKDPKPPSMTVKVGKKAVEVAQGSYCWSEWYSAICSDATFVEDIAKNVAVTNAYVGEKGVLSFDENPNKGSLSLSIHEGKEEKRIKVTNGAFELPDESGTYIYSAHATWEKGSAHYIFVVNVQDKH